MWAVRPSIIAYIWLVRSYSLLSVAVGTDSTILNSTVSCIACSCRYEIVYIHRERERERSTELQGQEQQNSNANKMERGERFFTVVTKYSSSQLYPSSQNYSYYYRRKKENFEKLERVGTPKQNWKSRYYKKKRIVGREAWREGRYIKPFMKLT